MFVDDINLINSNSYNHPTVNNLRYLLQTDINASWNDVLTTSGGHLNSRKTKFYILHWEFNPNGTPYLDTSVDSSIPITISIDDISEPITQIPPDKEPKQFSSLGIRTPATLADHYEILNMIKKGNTFSKFLNACPLTKIETINAYTMFFVPSYSYSAVSLSLTPIDIIEIHLSLIPDLLPKMG